MPYRLLPLEAGVSGLIGILVANVASFVSLIISATAELPPWASILLGPLGGLAGAFFAVWWLAKRLDRVERLATEQRQRDHEALVEILKSQIEIATKCHIAIERNSRALEHCAARNGEPE